MIDSTRLDTIRGDALDRIERTERKGKLAFFAAVGVEAALLAAFLLLANFGDRLHLLLFIATVAVYTIVALGLLAVSAHVSRNTQLVLRALAELGPETERDR